MTKTCGFWAFVAPAPRHRESRDQTSPSHSPSQFFCLPTSISLFPYLSVFLSLSLFPYLSVFLSPWRLFVFHTESWERRAPIYICVYILESRAALKRGLSSSPCSGILHHCCLNDCAATGSDPETLLRVGGVER